MADDIENQDRPESLSRRALIRGASVAVPTILTLNSNAAMGWAIASNTIGTRAAIPGNKNDVYCLETTGLPEVKNGVYALGSPPYAEVYHVPGSVQFKRKSGTGSSASWQDAYPQDVCLNGGVVKYKSGAGWRELNGGQAIPRRAMVSNVAVASFGNRVVPRSYTEL